MVDFFFILSGFVLQPKLSKSSQLQEKTIFIAARVIRLAPLPILSIIFMTVRPHVAYFQQNNYIAPNDTLAIIGAMLLLQIFSGEIVRVNLTLWSLSSELFVNITSVFLYKLKLINLIIGASIILIMLSIIMELPAEYGLFALSRTSLGFFLGVALRRKRVDREINLRRYYISILLIGLALYVGSKSTFAILLGIPPFMILILETSFMKEIKISHHMKIVMQFLGRNSFGIYVWQIPVNSILQSESIISALNLRPVGVMTQLLVVFSKLITVLIISELTTRFFDTPIQRFLTKKLNLKFDKIPNISS